MKSLGFTLIELMIVVAIIGVLAVLALPQYQGYVSRTQVNRLYSEVSHVKTLAEMYVNNGDFSFIETDIGWHGSSLADSSDGATPTPGDGLELLEWNTNNDGYGQLKVKFGRQSAYTIIGVNIYLEREQSGIWACQVEKGSSTAWSAKYLPDGCILLADGANPIDD
ncbi:pilin [Reinekea sp.]|jgi:type IV pilus assembly protein PilA|uniref:pilin n=1 Tax=Reinekea sp. TaxID=1970455 RepID=UPI003989BA8B